VIGALTEVVRQLLMEFYNRNNGKKPEAIIYYRDGVADSQFPTVLEYEYKAFRAVSFFLLGQGGGVLHISTSVSNALSHQSGALD
jgi:hypothetical protein